MKRILSLLALALALAAGAAGADDFPRQPIRIIVPFAPGTAADTVARVVAEELRISLAQPVLLEHRPGATGLVGIGSLAQAPADGYTIGLGIEATHVTIPLVRKKVAYDPLNDFTPLTLAVRTTMAIAVNPDVVQVKDLPGLLQAAKTRAGGVTFGTMGEGSPQQLIGELLKQRTGARFEHVPYAGSAAAIEDLLAGKVGMVITPLATVAGHQDKLRIIAVADATRVANFPDVQAIAETLPGVVVTGWAGFFAPAKLAPALAKKLSAAIAAALRKPAVMEALRKRSMEPAASSPEEFRELLKAELSYWAPVVEKAHMQKVD
ncbi:Bug family tripartite tricarboxylate transporter substrate binding protein [Ramlibacter sp. AN1133]|uniref:Bug family tripartite tricarboxylate transporter substrate binding protein n=1 Tax=Ramlibacter sp. AN1133 TaxID=3133429 RepID=UPI0030BF42F8